MRDRFFNFWCLLAQRASCLTNLGLDFAVAAVFIALVIPEVKTVPTLVCVLASATSSLLFLFYGFELGLIASAGIGMLCGYGMQRARS